VCIMFLSGGRCEKGDLCSLKHPTDPDEIIHWIEFFKKTQCKWGPGCRWQPRCLYRHDGGDQNSLQDGIAGGGALPGQPGVPQHKVCLMHLASNCDKGPNCPLRHPEDPAEILQWLEVFKRVPCKWAAGCKWAGKCIFAHPEGTPQFQGGESRPAQSEVHAATEIASLQALADAQLAGEGCFQAPPAPPALPAPPAQFWPELQVAPVLPAPPPAVVPPPPRVVPPAPLTMSKSSGAPPAGALPAGSVVRPPPHAVAPPLSSLRPAGPVVVPPPPPSARFSAPMPDIMWAGFGEMPNVPQLPRGLPMAPLPCSLPGMMPSFGVPVLPAVFPPPAPGALLEAPPLAAPAPAPNGSPAQSLLTAAHAAALVLG